MGSPPPMRGKEAGLLQPLLMIRITPAYAGKSRAWLNVEDYTGDHPRLCGEKRDAEPKRTDQKGSPPPMRGKVLNGFRDNPYYRITPAYAGKSTLYTLCLC